MAAELRFGATQLGAAKYAATIAAWLAGFEVRHWPVEATYHYAEARTALEPENWPGARQRQITKQSQITGRTKGDWLGRMGAQKGVGWPVIPWQSSCLGRVRAGYYTHAILFDPC